MSLLLTKMQYWKATDNVLRRIGIWETEDTNYSLTELI